MPDDDEQETERFIQSVVDLIAEDEPAELLSVTVRGNAITVTKIDTDMWMTFEKRPDNPHLVVARTWDAPSPATQNVAKFRAQAFQLAAARARQLGWIG